MKVPIAAPIHGLDVLGAHDHVASEVSDSAGERTARLLFQPGAVAEAVLPNGGHVALDSLTVRVTEFTDGPDGPQAMAGELPPTTAYTYAVDIHVDELDALGAEHVEFDTPVAYYMENFLDLPVGSAVPVA